MSKKRSRSKRASDTKKPEPLNIMPSVVTLDSVTEQRKKEIQKRANDGFANFISRIGAGPNVDNQLSEGHYELNLLTRNRLQLEAAYRGSWIVGAMIDSVAEDMTKAGIDITSSEAAEDIQELQSGLQRLRIWSSLCDVIKWARLYGGAIGVMMVDGQDLDTPLRIETVGRGQFSGLAVYDRWQLFPDLTSVIPNGPDLGLPAYYYIVTSQTFMAASGNEQSNLQAVMQNGVRVHHSRVIRQIGVKLPFFQAITEMMWGSSELERIHDRLISFDTATMSAANLINHANLRTVRVDRLREILSTGGQAEEGLIKMFDYMRLLQSNEGITLLDKEDEFSSTAYSFAGLSDMMLQFGQQLSGASGIPLVRLFGQSPAGLNSTGESDIRNYYDNINAQQEANLRDGVTKVLRIAYQSLFGKPAPSDLQFKFTSLWQMSAEQKANVGKTITETVVGAYEAGAISREIMMKELRQQSSETGIFTNITDEDIVEAEGDVPLPGGELEIDPTVELKPEEIKEVKATDSLFMRVMKKLGSKA